MNNGQYRILKLLGDVGKGVPGLELPGLDVVRLARSLGCEGETVEHPEELSDAFGRAFVLGRPYVLNVLVDPSVPKTLN